MASQDRAASTFSSMSSMSSPYTSTRRSRAAERTLRREVGPLAQELSSPKEPPELDSSSVHWTHPPRQSQAARSARGIALGRPSQRLAGLESSTCPHSRRTCPRGRASRPLQVENVATANASSSVSTECSPQSTREVKSTSHRSGRRLECSTRCLRLHWSSAPCYRPPSRTYPPHHVAAAGCAALFKKAGRGGLSLTPASCADIVAGHRSPL